MKAYLVDYQARVERENLDTLQQPQKRARTYGREQYQCNRDSELQRAWDQSVLLKEKEREVARLEKELESRRLKEEFRQAQLDGEMHRRKRAEQFERDYQISKHATESISQRERQLEEGLGGACPMLIGEGVLDRGERARRLEQQQYASANEQLDRRIRELEGQLRGQ